MKARLFFVLASILLVVVVVEYECCKEVDARRAISYKLIKRNARSTKSIISRRRFTTVAKCKDFAEAKYALAFNFERLALNDSWEANCLLLRCPETAGLRQLENITGVDYYSAYTNNTHIGNASLSCVEQVGVFTLFSEKMNFTNARASCQKIHGTLADVTSDARTRGLSSLIGEFLVFVGLSNEGNRRAWKNEYGDQLSCFEYRAWDTGEPSHSRGCVGLFRVDRKSDPVWKVISCSTELPYICEIPRWQNKTHDSKKKVFLLV